MPFQHVRRVLRIVLWRPNAFSLLLKIKIGTECISFFEYMQSFEVNKPVLYCCDLMAEKRKVKSSPQNGSEARLEDLFSPEKCAPRPKHEPSVPVKSSSTIKKYRTRKRSDL